MGNCLAKFCRLRTRDNRRLNNERIDENNDQTTNIVQSPNEQIKTKPLNKNTEENRYQTTNIEKTQDELVSNKPHYQCLEENNCQLTNTQQTQDEQITNKPHYQRREENNYQTTNIEQTHDAQFEYNSFNQVRNKKLESFFQRIILNAPVDFTSPEIQDIQDAVHTMLERIRTRVNNRCVFNITRIVPTGSMAEKTAIWKYGDDEKETYLECDNLAVLKESVRQCEDHSDNKKCPGCIRISKSPIEFTRVAKQDLNLIRERWNNMQTFPRRFKEDLGNAAMINDIFIYEISNGLTSSCDCLSLHFERTCYSFQPSSLDNKYGCDKCIVDMPTGTLSVNTKKNVSCGPFTGGRNKCSLILKWTSKTNSLLAPDKSLQQKQPITSMPIYIDFLPAMESLKPTSTDARYTHAYYIVPKKCNVCGNDSEFASSWRKSGCMAEIQALKTEMSEKHRRCFHIVKYLAKDIRVNKYLLKNAVLRHSITCSDRSDNYVDCVIKVYQNTLSAFNRRDFTSYHSNINILSNTHHAYCRINKAYYQEFLTQLYSVSETDTFDRFVTRLWSSCKSAANNAVSYA